MGVAEQALDAAQHAEQAVRDSAQDAELVETRRTAMTASDAAQFARDIAHEAREAAQEAQETAKQAYEAAEKAEHSSTTDFDRIAEATCMAADAAMKAAESAREAAQEVIDHHAGVRPAGPRTATRTKSSKGPPRRKPAPQAKKKDGLIL